MLSVIPLPWKLYILAAVIALSSASAYVLGRKHVREQWNAANAAAAVLAAKKQGEAEATERMWANAAKVAGDKYDERIKAADTRADANRLSLRDAYANRNAVPERAATPPGCPGPSGPSAAELLAKGEELAGLVQDA